MKKFFSQLCSWRGFFWLANLICMAFSAQNAGFFLGLYEPLGLAVAFVIDLAIIVFMQAMLSAKARGESSRAYWIVGAIVLCALLSTVGNIVHNLQVQDVTKISHLAPWFQMSLPFISSSTPMLLVIFALVADLVTKSNPLDSTNLEEYKAHEEKRLLLLEIQIANRQKQVAMKQQLHAIIQMEKQIKRTKKVPEIEHPKQVSEVPQIEALEAHKNDTENATEIDTPDDEESAQEEQDCSDEPLESNANNITLLRTEKRTTLRTDTRSEKALKAIRIIKRNPEITAAELAKKAQISPSYARQLLAKQMA